MEELKYLFSFFIGFMFGVMIEEIVVPWIRNNTGKKKRKEEKEYPCATCLRWEECNGTDDACPLISEEEK